MVSLHDHLLNIAPLFVPDRFVDAIGAIFGLHVILSLNMG